MWKHQQCECGEHEWCADAVMWKYHLCADLMMWIMCECEWLETVGHVKMWSMWDFELGEFVHYGTVWAVWECALCEMWSVWYWGWSQNGVLWIVWRCGSYAQDTMSFFSSRKLIHFVLKQVSDHSSVIDRVISVLFPCACVLQKLSGLLEITLLAYCCPGAVFLVIWMLCLTIFMSCCVCIFSSISGLPVLASLASCCQEAAFCKDSRFCCTDTLLCLSEHVINYILQWWCRI